MIVSGGLDPTMPSGLDPWNWNTTADPWPQCIGVFDMTELRWKSSYEAKAPPYTSSDIIKQYYQSGYTLHYN